FRTLEEVREITMEWMAEYNEIRPHESLGNLPPRAFLMKNSGKVSNLSCA
ncbi:MAG: integrase core domain-containing protein, partial [Oxalobacter sp.]|nr:integrase core domain-containing protein [Oxalobacter sp.]